MWLLCLLLFTFSSAAPLSKDILGQVHYQLGNFHTTPIQKICLPPTLLGQICLPSPFQNVIPLQTITSGLQHCFSIPLMRSYVLKVCPASEETSKSGENSTEPLREIISEVGEEKEKELLSRDNANIEVKEGEVESENFVKKENGVESKESRVEDKDMESKNKIIRISEEIIEVGDESESPQQPPLSESSEKNSDENVNIMSNLV